MFVYCGNNPIIRSDPSGKFWKEIGDWFSNTWNGIKKWASNTFGASSSTVKERKSEDSISKIFNDNMPIIIKVGTKGTKTISKQGDSSKPISVYALRNIDHPIKSSCVGLKLNISNFTLKVNLSLDNIGIYGSVVDGNTTNSFGIRADLSNFKLGFDSSTTVQWDENTSYTTYTNVDINGWTLVAIFIFKSAGKPVPTPTMAPAY